MACPCYAKTSDLDRGESESWYRSVSELSLIHIWKAQKRPVTFIKVKDVRTAMAQIAVRFYGHPSKDLLTIGITGTKGKTSTAYMIWRILEDSGIKTGIIGTIFTGYEGNLRESSNTTPQSVERCV